MPCRENDLEVEATIGIHNGQAKATVSNNIELIQVEVAALYTSSFSDAAFCSV